MEITHRSLFAAGIKAFPCKVWRKPDGTFGKAPAVPRGVSWKAVADSPTLYPDLDWTTGVYGLPIPPGVLVIDLDTYKGSTRDSVERFLGAPLDWDAGFIQRTVGGGEHYAFQCPPGEYRQLKGGDGFDIRAPGRGFICTGRGYQQVGFGVLRFATPESLPPLPQEAAAALMPPNQQTHTPSVLADDDDVLAALKHIDPGCTRPEWVRIGLALRAHYGERYEDGLAVFDAWSRGDYWDGTPPHNYDPDIIERQWASFKPDGGVTASTLFYSAIQCGWVPRSSLDTAAAFGTGARPDTFAELVDRVRDEGQDAKNIPSLAAAIRAAGCDTLQTALLAAELKTTLKEAGVSSAQVSKAIDGLLCGGAPSAGVLRGATPQSGAALDPGTPLSPLAWAANQTKGKDMRPRGTLDNFRILLSAYGLSVSFDEIHKTLVVDGPGAPSGGVLKQEAAVAYIESLCNLNDYPVAAMRSMLPAVANDNPVNPVAEWIRSTAWDGKDHVGELFRQLTLDDDEDAAFCEVLFRKWMRGAYAVGVGKIRRWEHCIVLIDQLGGAGKTRFFATMCPEDLRVDSVILDTANKDSVKLAVSYWLTELGELDGTFSRSESARLKAFLSMEADEMRPPYGRAAIKYPRRTAFFASVNNPHFLLDGSDNRRWWGVSVKKANHLHDVDVQQAWAQVAAEVEAGAVLYLTDEEDQELRRRNEMFRTHSPIADALSGLDIQPAPGESATVLQILAAAGLHRPSRGEMNEAARWLRRAGYQERRKGGRSTFAVSVSPGTSLAFKPRAVQ